METTIKRCSSVGSGSEKKTTTHFYVYITCTGQLRMYKLDVSRHFSSDFNYSVDGRPPPPPMLKPYFSMDGFPSRAATAALGSRIYIVGGGGGEEYSDAVLPRSAAYAIDVSAEKLVTLPPLRWGKSKPIAWTIGGKLDVVFTSPLRCFGLGLPRHPALLRVYSSQMNTS